jgi:hypothetical protein
MAKRKMYVIIDPTDRFAYMPNECSIPITSTISVYTIRPTEY